MNAQKKDDTEFIRIYTSQKSLVFRTAMKYSGGNYHISQEITQEVFLKLYAHFDEYHNEEYLIGWLITAARNAALNYKKKAGREQPDAEIELTIDSRISDIDTETRLLQSLACEENRQLGRKILDDLYQHNERWFDAVTMVYGLGRKQQDVADEFGISIRVLHNVLYRARKWIQKHYDHEIHS